MSTSIMRAAKRGALLLPGFVLSFAAWSDAPPARPAPADSVAAAKSAAPRARVVENHASYRVIQDADGSLTYVANSEPAALDRSAATSRPASVQADGLETLYSFPAPNGIGPKGRMALGPDGNYYGTTRSGGTGGGPGTVFMLAPGGALTTIHSFTPAEGSDSEGGLVLGSDGAFYGANAEGGNLNAGTVFRVTSGGDVTILHSFNVNDGVGPFGGVTQASDGNFYGATLGGGTASGGAAAIGTIFQVTPSGVFTSLHTFSGPDGSSPLAAPVEGADGALYGMTQSGGASSGGVAYRISKTGEFSVLHSFSSTEGRSSQTGLVLANDGMFYGTTQSNSAGNGTVFRMTPAGGVTTLHQFPFQGSTTEGTRPVGGLIQGADGALYGTTANAGPSNQGSVFRLALDGTLTTLHFFNGTDGGTPTSTLVQGSDFRLYGPASRGHGGGGVVFAASLAQTYADLHDFGAPNGSTATAGLVKGKDGNFYGATESGGTAGGYGTVYRITSAGKLTRLHSFSQADGADPYSALATGNDNALYGTADFGGSGGYGEVFSIQPDGTLSILHTFNSSGLGYPQAGLTLASNGLFYGAASNGEYFSISPGGTYTGLHSTSGEVPLGTLVESTTDGDLYGTTEDGGGQFNGSIFRISKDGLSFATLYSFSGGSDGANPEAGLVQGSDGTLYGTTQFGGATGHGAVFSISPFGSFSVLHSFTCAEGAYPLGALARGPDGNLYGTTAVCGAQVGNGTVFRITPAGAFTTLHTFHGADGASPIGTLLFPGDGYLYGTTQGGGPSGAGTIFRFPSTLNGLAPPIGVTAVAGDSQVSLSWSAVAGASSYNIYAGTTAGQEDTDRYFSVTSPSAILHHSTDGTPLANGTTYYFKIAAVGSNGTGPLSAEVSARPVAPPAAPTGVTITPGIGKVTLSWNASAGATGYSIYQGTSAGGEGAVAVHSGAARSAAISGLSNGTTYYFKVAATNAGGASPLSAEVSATPQALPAKPVSVSAIGGDGLVNLSWAASSGASSYSVYQGLSAGGEDATPVKTGIGATATSISGLSNGTPYYFKIVAVNSSGSSPRSAEVSATSAPPPPAPANLAAVAGNAQVSLSWSASAGATSYSVYQGTAAGHEAATPVLSGITATGATLTGLGNGTTYYFKVVALTGVAASAPSAEASARPVAPPAAPTGVTAAAGAGKVTLSWSASAGATSYNVYQGTAPDAEGASPVRSLAARTVAISGLTKGQTYYFEIAAVNAGGASPRSIEVSATAQ